ncbi:TetR/AcrR family transcriptional regulator [Alteribacillus iranensis]|uniref:DNA-binding transcriptional regulator, AcrR family n=1 Tax=Alteribacillus iranensis TaxID=930128 RepID=A0A1I2DN16_9BACI|nr:TetR/AcrR family transcriptional regulator [Alteribacillus iranensis]SFE81994.1 DNA-binding transcriptional regulator, AcrR family [Alteribacillus iranensis]
MSKDSRKVVILHAAARIVKERGIFNLTLEAAAREAGMSKGGLLYHFPSKEALVQGMVEHLANNYMTKIEENAENDPVDEGKWTRAFLNVTFNQTYQNKDMNAGLLAAKAVKPELLQPINKAYAKWQEHIENDGLDPVTATIIRLATDGIWLSELFEIHHLDDEIRNQVLQTLEEWANNKKCI